MVNQESGTSSRSRYWLIFILAASFAVYLPLINSYYCGFDDFTEVYKAAYQDSDNPELMFTTTHQGTPKYRPLNRALTWATYQLGQGSAAVYRWRNVLMHLVGVAAIWQLAQLAGQSVTGASLTALAFGIHPLAHQTVAAASWTNSTAYALALWSWFALASAWSLQKPLVRIVIGTALFFLALFSYEATIVILAPLTLDLIWRRLRGWKPASSWKTLLIPQVAGIGGCLALFVIGRLIFVQGRMPITPPGQLLKNTALYLGSMTLPFDLLLLNSILDFPLPSQLAGNFGALAGLGLVCLFFLAVLLLLFIKFRINNKMQSNTWPWLWLIGIPAALSPFLLNTDHASETYLYLPLALWCLFVGGQLEYWIDARILKPIIITLLLLEGSSSLLRSDRVRSCGATARRVIDSLPIEQWRTGTPDLYFTSIDGMTSRPHYGLYSSEGLATIDVQSEEVAAMEAALRVETGNRQLKAKAVRPSRFAGYCESGTAECYVVWPDGVAERKLAPKP